MGRRGWWWEFIDVLIRPLLLSFGFAKCDKAREEPRAGARESSRSLTVAHKPPFLRNVILPHSPDGKRIQRQGFEGAWLPSTGSTRMLGSRGGEARLEGGHVRMCEDLLPEENARLSERGGRLLKTASISPASLLLYSLQYFFAVGFRVDFPPP